MNENLPVRHSDPTDVLAMPIGMRVVFDDALNERIKSVAGIMSRAEGMTPPHLVGKSEACYAVVVRALTWRLDPFSVAACTYMTPGGKVGYEGKLIQAALENSGQVEGRVSYEFYGDWSKVEGRIKKGTSRNGKEIWERDWSDKDEEGLGVIVRAQVHGEAGPREERYDLKTFQPRNSILWATRPKQQICYTAVRAFANLACPGIIMGVPFEGDLGMERGMVDITPPDQQPADPLERAYEAGRQAYRNRESARSAPRNLRPAEHEQWTKGFKAEMDLEHGEAENVEYEARKKAEEEAADADEQDAAKTEPSKGKAEPEGKSDPDAGGDLIDRAMADLKDDKPKAGKTQAAKAAKQAKAEPEAGDGPQSEVADPEGLARFADPQYEAGIIDDLDAAETVEGLHDAISMYEDDKEHWSEALFLRIGEHFEKRLDQIEKKKG